MLRKMKNLYGRIFAFTPLTFILPNEYTKFVDEYTQAQERQVWICKPPDLSRGRKIFLLNDISQLTYDSNLIIQKYIENPLLIGGYKWDMRIYVVVTSLRPLKIYLYQEGLVRFSTEKFDMSSIDNKFIHLTNSSINKFSPSLNAYKGVVGSGSKWTFEQLKNYYSDRGYDFKLLWFRIEIIIINTLLSLATLTPHLDCCFELFGFDVIVDCTHKPWLLEINTPPALAVENPID